MASRENRVKVTVDILADASKAESVVKKLGTGLDKVKMTKVQAGGLETVKQNLDDIYTEMKEISKQEVDAAGIKRLAQLSAEADKETKKLRNTYNTLAQSKGTLDILPKDTQSAIRTAEKEIANYEKEIGKTTEALKLLNSVQSSQAARGQKFDISDKSTENAKELHRILKQLGVDVDQLNGAKFGEIQKVISSLPSGQLQKVAEAFKQLTGQDLDPAVQDVDSLVRILNNVKTDQIKQADAALEQFGRDSVEAAQGAGEVAQGIRGAEAEFGRLAEKSRQIDTLTASLQHFFSIQNTIQLFKRGVREAINVVQELDAAMAETAVVTDFTINDLWEQLPTYKEMANRLGVTIKDVYEASTLYYQQGLNQKQTMEVTNQTLQMARIAGLGAAEATDMMTAALRGFNMEVNEENAQRVNDIFSELAAVTASDTKELGIAMEKTASIAHSAGMSIEVTTALLAQAIETTREAPENIGTAMKTIVARFQELKKNPLTITEVDGDMVDFNKVDTALKTIGINIVQDSENFENLDVIMEKISERWDGLTQTQRRYIATIVAGSRQQSRFIAMMGNHERLQELITAAYDSEGAAARQYEKTQASLETAFNRLSNAWNEFLMGIANNKLIKTGATILTKGINLVNKLLSVLEKLPPGINDVSKAIVSLGLAFGGLQVARLGALEGVGLLTDFWFKNSPGRGLQALQKAGISQGRYGRIFNTLKAGGNLPTELASYASVKELNEVQKGMMIERATQLGVGGEFNPKGYFKNILVKGRSGYKSGLEQVSKAANGLQKTLGGVKGAAAGMWDALEAGGQIALVIAGVMAVIGVLNKVIVTAKEAQEARDKVFDQHNSNLDDIQKQRNSIEDLRAEYETLSSGVDENGRNVGLSASEYERYNSLVNELISINPQLVKGYTAEGNAIIDKNNAIKDSIKYVNDLTEAENKEFYSAENVKKVLKGFQADIQLARSPLRGNWVANTTGRGGLSFGGYYDEETDLTPEQIVAANQKLQARQAENTNYLVSLALETGYLDDLTDSQQKYYHALISTKVEQDEINSSNYNEQLRSAAEEVEKLSDVYGKHTDKIEKAQKTFEESGKGGADIKTYNSAIKSSISALEALRDERIKSGKASEEEIAAINKLISGYEDYKKQVVSLTQAYNPLSVRVQKADSAIQTFKEMSNNMGDYYTQIKGMSEAIETALSDENKAGRGSRTYWLAASTFIGEDKLKELGYNKKKVDAYLKGLQNMTQTGRKGYNSFKDLVEQTARQPKGAYKQYDTVEKFLQAAAKADDKKFKSMAKYLGMSEESLAAMLNNAQQFVDIDLTNYKMLAEAYKTEEGIATSENGEKVFLTRERFRSDYYAQKGTYRGVGRAQQAFIDQNAGKVGLIDITGERQTSGKTLKAYAKQFYGKKGKTDITTEEMANFLIAAGANKEDVKAALRKNQKVLSDYQEVKQDNGIDKLVEELSVQNTEDLVDDIASDTKEIASLLRQLLGQPNQEAIKEYGENRKKRQEEIENTPTTFSTKEEKNKTLKNLHTIREEAESEKTKIEKAFNTNSGGMREMYNNLDSLDDNTRKAVQTWYDLEQQVQDTDDLIRKINRTSIKPKVETKGVSKVEQAVKQAQESLGVLDGQRATASIHLETNGALTTLKELISKFREWKNLGNSGSTPAGTKGHPRAKGQNNRVPGHPSFAGGRMMALTGELGPEIVWSPSDGSYYVTGANGPEIRPINKDDVIYTAAQSKKIARKHPEVLRGQSFAKGKSFASGTDLPYRRELGQIYNTLQKISAQQQKVDVIEQRLQTRLAGLYLAQNDLDRNNLYFTQDLREQQIKSLKEIVKLNKNIKSSLGSNLNQTKKDLTSDINSSIKELRKEGKNSKEISQLNALKKNLGKYVKVDKENGTITITKQGKALKGAAKEALATYVGNVEKLFEENNKAQIDQLKAQEEIYLLYREDQENGDKLYESVRDGVVKKQEDNIKRLTVLNDTISTSNEKLLQKAQEQINIARQNRENEKARQNLEDKRTRLSLLMQDTQGGHQVELANLQKELMDETTSFQDSLVDQQFDKIDKANQYAQQQRQRQIDLMQKQLDWWQDTGRIWNAVHELVLDAYSGGSFSQKSAAMQAMRYGQSYGTSNFFQKRIIDQDKEQEGVKAQTAMTARLGTLAQRGAVGSKGGGLGENENVWVTVSDGNGGTKRVQGKYHYNDGYSYIEVDGKKYFDKDITPIDSNFSNNEYIERGIQGTSGNVTPKTDSEMIWDLVVAAINKIEPGTSLTSDKIKGGVTEAKKHVGKSVKLRKGSATISSGGKAVFASGRKIKVYDPSTGRITSTTYSEAELLKKSGVTKKNGTWVKSTNTSATWLEYWQALRSIDPKKYSVAVPKKYAAGGLVDYTGPAWVDGSSRKPEAFLSAADTKNLIQLKDVLATVLEYNSTKGDAFNSATTGDTNYEINISVDHIANDYDVDKLANRIKKIIVKDASYRNPLKVVNMK